MAKEVGEFSRRAFLGTSSKLVASLGVPSYVGLVAQKAIAQEVDGYKAIICVTLRGGYDNWSGLVPFDEVTHGQYAVSRSDLALSRTQLSGSVLQPRNDLGQLQYALHPSLASLLPIFAAGHLSFIQSIGALVEPTTRLRIESGTSRLPPQLFSHNDQRSYVLSNLTEGGDTGWGGRIADSLLEFNSNPAFTCLNEGEGNIFLYGARARPYSIDRAGATILLNGATSFFGTTQTAGRIATVATAPQSGLLRAEYVKITQRALQSGNQLNALFSSLPESDFPEFANESRPFNIQLRNVVRGILAGMMLGLRRQVIHVCLGDWDSHAGQTALLTEKFAELSEGMANLWAALGRLGLLNSVTTFTMSDFGRTLVSNGNGTNHGWGSNHFVMGGAVAGGRILGQAPQVGVNSPDVVAGGRLIPTTSFDQLAATLAMWLGVPVADLPRIAPNLVNFSQEQWRIPIFQS